ncbi:hypothetical protein JVU11DRAFT_12483 [Chiua virens]|nr:hypothetical protein JVU11DRAFT_12483 [Chiua virens]
MDVESAGQREEEFFFRDIDLAGLLKAYEDDRPEDEEPTHFKFKLICEEEAYIFCNTVLALAPVKPEDSDPILKSLQEEASQLKGHVCWREAEQAWQEPEVHPGTASQFPLASPSQKRLKTTGDAPESLNHRQFRCKSRQRRVKKDLQPNPPNNSHAGGAAINPASVATSILTTPQIPADGPQNRTGRGCQQRHSHNRLHDKAALAQRLRCTVEKNLQAKQVLTLPVDVCSAPVSKTGWVGRTVSTRAEKQEMRHLFESGEVLYVLKAFQRIPYDDWVASFAIENAAELNSLLAKLVGDIPISRKKLWERYGSNPRGNHVPFLLGLHRQYTKDPTLSELHRLNEKQSDRKHVCRVLELHFPECAARYKFAVDFWKERGYKAQFGLFFNFCPNIPLPEGAGRVHTLPHADHKNIAGGICALMAYSQKRRCSLFLIPFKLKVDLESFNSKERTWLVIWELRVILELPLGVVLLYPSALFYHFNIDITGMWAFFLHTFTPLHSFLPDLEVISSEDFLDITKQGKYPKWHSDAQGRGSLVWFNQASMIQAACVGHRCLKEAKEAGVDTATNFQEDAHGFFTPAAVFIRPN